ncbi:MAG: TetR/AcrR family transcriptional regulator [Burkholderiales bacterium]
METNTIESPDQIRARILEASQERFSQFGYGKTTMAEVAKDCGMSAANLYRYFENKQDIGVQLCNRCLGNEVAALRALTERNDISARERLERWTLETLGHVHDRWLQHPRINELVEVIAKERLDVVQVHIAAKHRMLTRLLEEGRANGEFDVPDPSRAAEAILNATILFDVPLFMPMFSLEEFERRARIVTEFILRAVLKR